MPGHSWETWMAVVGLILSALSVVAVFLGAWYIRKQAKEARRAYQAQAFVALTPQLAPAVRAAKQRCSGVTVREDLMVLEALAVSAEEDVVPLRWAVDVWGPFLDEPWRTWAHEIAEWRQQPGNARLFAHWESLCREVAKSGATPPDA